MLQETTPCRTSKVQQLVPHTLLLATAAVLLPACSSSDDPPPPPPDPAQTLSGAVLDSGGGALAGVTVSMLDGMVESVTDAQGIYVLTGELPTGNVAVNFDGTTVGSAGYPSLTLMAALVTGNNTFPTTVILPDLDQGPTQQVNTNTSGATNGPILVADGTDYVVTGPVGTVISLDGMPAASQAIDLGLTPLVAGELPSALPAGANGQSFFSFEPWNYKFDANGMGVGLDVRIDNFTNLPTGTQVDLYLFDQNTGSWVNRSQQSGAQGEVVVGGGGTRIDIFGLISDGGIYATAIPTCTTCTWTIDTTVQTSDGTPIEGATVALETGQFAATDVDGRFIIEGVTAYNLNASMQEPPVGTTVDVDWAITLPAALGSEVTTGTIAGGSVQSGETYNIPFVVTANPVGLLSGVVQAMPADPGGSISEVELVPLDDPGSTPLTQIPGVDGSFFFTNLVPGDYQVSYLFDPSPDGPVISGAEVEVGKVSSVLLSEGAESNVVDILVMLDDDGDLTTAAVPLEGARVTIAGANGSAGERTTDSNGAARFINLEGPFTVTAQADVTEFPTTVRIASTVTGLMPQDGIISVPLLFEPELEVPIVNDAVLAGTISNANLSASEALGIVVFAHGLPAEDSVVAGLPLVPSDGVYALNVPSDYALSVAVLITDLGGSGNASVQATEMILAQDIGPIAPAGNLVQDFDFDGQGVVLLDLGMNVSFTNQLPSATASEVSLLLDNGDDFEGRLPIALFPASLLSGALMAPDLTDGGLGGWGAGFGAGAEGGSDEAYCSLLLTDTPADIEFPLNIPPIFTSPTDGQVLSIAEVTEMTVSLSGAAGGVPAGWAGLNIIEIAGDADLGGGVDAMSWLLWLRDTEESIVLPATSWPMFVDGNPYGLDADRFRFESGMAFDYETFFDDDLAVRLVGLFQTMTGLSEAFTEIGITVTEPTPSE